MKKQLFGFILGIAVMGLLAMKPEFLEKKSACEADQQQGFYLFVKSRPITEYEILGTVKGPTIGSHEFDDLLASIVKKAKDKYPQGNGILFDGPIKQTHNTTVTIVKLKE